ncbi:hypothetical protein LK994_13000 [Ferruginibacter lapsinanis]|uniref:hypothetical protein n=1 Tax=Ferruginibacter lapsinanis TaxID=563172 RepID=UPI001E3C951C|nr:hypothetical protein [Ferruginibacter lapsinanis]UEG49552.1 hypothetical protein LK994_13000 [Ferruginibacter lapsinanis]
MKQIFRNGLIAGLLLTVICYGGLFIAVTFFPQLFVDYLNPLFTSSTSRDVMFYAHAFIISFALSWFWERFKSLFVGNFILRGLEFGAMYAVIALVPVMWISFSAMDITVPMVLSWLFYGLLQAIVAGILFAKLSP